MPAWFGPSNTKFFKPLTWQGWLATAALAVGVVCNRFFFRPEFFGLRPLARPVLGLILMVGYLALVYFTYDNEA